MRRWGILHSAAALIAIANRGSREDGMVLKGQAEDWRVKRNTEEYVPISIIQLFLPLVSFKVTENRSLSW